MHVHVCAVSVLCVRMRSTQLWVLMHTYGIRASCTRQRMLHGKIVATLYRVSNWRWYYLFSINFPIRRSAVRKTRRLIAVLSILRLCRRQDNFMAHEYHKCRRVEISRGLKVVVNYAYGFASRISKIDTQIVCHSIYKLRSTDSLSLPFSCAS